MSVDVSNNRVLIVDDNEAIHHDIRRVLDPVSTTDDEILADEAFLFGDSNVAAQQWRVPDYSLTSVYQGKDALVRVTESVTAGHPFAVAIMDMRMPPGWNGVETVQRIWEVDPNLLIIFCTAFSDFSWKEMNQALGRTDRFVLLKKPFDNAELQQLVAAMVHRWSSERQAEVNLAQLARLTQERHVLEARLQQAERMLAQRSLFEVTSRQYARALPSRVLVVDETPSDAEATLVALQSAGATVEIVDSAEDVLNESLMALSTGQLAQALVLEMASDQSDVYSIVRELRQASYSGCIVAYTRHERPGDREACLAAGCDAWVPKSAGIEGLVRSLQNCGLAVVVSTEQSA